jgi:hypothetical protein
MNPKHIKVVTWLIWVATFSKHPFLALYFLPTAVAVSRRHAHSVFIFFLNLALGWTPTWFLIMLYAVQPNDGHPMRISRRPKYQQRVTIEPIEFKKSDKVITI